MRCYVPVVEFSGSRVQVAKLNTSRVLKDSPAGHEEKVAMLKDAGAGLCKRCFYVKRGSLANMKLSELINNIQESEGFADKLLGWFMSELRG